MNTYISLFSSAGIGCHGFKLEGFECIATCELLERRIKMQSYNHKCRYDSGYISGDITLQETQDRIFEECSLWRRKHNVRDIDVVIATPPCQGMSVANHKKYNEEKEIKRNSLVVESINMVKTLSPKFFIFENVRSFLTTGCVDVDGVMKPIREAIFCNLGGIYNILPRVLNFKDYGNNSSRTRTLVIGVRRDIRDTNPFLLFPDRQDEKTLREVIGHLPSLTKMGEFCKNDLYHGFRSYSPYMEDWIKDLKEGQSAFENEDEKLRPHTIKDGKIIPNVQKNGDKYTRCVWDKVAPCIHTRNDILASQNTIHPQDNRVFSIRELMLLMTIPSSYQWSSISNEELQSLDDERKRSFLKKEEMNIRQNIGEAVPTCIFQQIAHKIKIFLETPKITSIGLKKLVEQILEQGDAIRTIIEQYRDFGFVQLSKIIEQTNTKRDDNAAYYTSQDVCFSVVKYLPDFSDSRVIRILEPAVGLGNFLPSIFAKYENVSHVILDVFDIDNDSIQLTRELLKLIRIPNNFTINYINKDTLLYCFDVQYDVVIGNPPYKKINKSKVLALYKEQFANKETNNLYAFFIEKAISIAKYIALIVPKSLINAPEFNCTRVLLNNYQISHIVDYGETAFKGVKIETISFVVNTSKAPTDTIIESAITEEISLKRQSYITDSQYPYWLLYRDDFFDNIADKLEFNIFNVFRDRTITKLNTKSHGKYRVLKSRNIGDNKIIDIEDYDSYIDDIETFAISKYLNMKNCYLVPNLTYNPRACTLPKDCIADGSVAILTPKSSSIQITQQDLSYFATEEFTCFYRIARNRGTRSLNIDSNSVFFFGKVK